MPVLTRSQVESAVAGSLLSAIDAHGPITPDNLSSASKRIVSQLKAMGIFKPDEP